MKEREGEQPLDNGTIQFMVSTMWNDIEGKGGIKETLIDFVSTFKERDRAEKSRRFWYTLLISLATLIIAAVTFYAAYMSHETAKHTGSLSAEAKDQTAEERGKQITSIPVLAQSMK